MPQDATPDEVWDVGDVVQPKGDPSWTGVNFAWDSATEAERYGQVGGKHHYDYPDGS